MKKKVTFKIELEYTTTTETTEDSPEIEDAIEYEIDSLRCYREDLNDALINSELINISIKD